MFKRKLRDIESLLNEPDSLSDSIKASIDHHLDSIVQLIKGSNTKTPILIWSDGACSGNPGPGGWGTIIQSGDIITELSGNASNTTNNIMELTGALEGIKRAPKGADVILTSDSQYLVKGMTEWISGWKRKNWKKADGKPVLNKALWIELDRESSSRSIQWEWIKGHAGHPQNERCDELARLAVKNL